MVLFIPFFEVSLFRQFLAILPFLGSLIGTYGNQGYEDENKLVPQQINLSSIEKIRQNAENKQTFDLSGKIEIEGKSRQTSEKINKLLI